MVNPHSTIQALRAALQVSPDNIPLRQHLADTLMSVGYVEEAEQEYRQSLALEPDNPALQLGLAQAFHQRGKTPQAIVLVESQLKQGQRSLELCLFYVRLLLEVGDDQSAIAQYQAAIAANPDAKDADLEARLGIREQNPTQAPTYVPASLNGLSDRGAIQLPKITFKDVGGMDAIKAEIQIKIIAPFQHPQLFQAYGKPVGGSLLMYGPPGCGKTYLARATAGEIRSNFLAVGINEILDMWVGSSERNLHDVFEQARRNRPCVLFFDEVDALAADRINVRYGAGRTLVNHFLAELDGVQSSNEGVLILAATNAPWYLDPAFRRPGRFDRVLFVPPPDAPARTEILRLLCRGKPQRTIDFNPLIKRTERFSGADLKAVVDLAVEQKLRDAIHHGVQPLTTNDLATAITAVKPSTLEWFSNARNYAVYANEGGLYDDILKYLKQ